MTKPILVKIIGAPVACKDGIKESWRKVADWAAGQLKSRFGDNVVVQYYDLFDPQCPSIPMDSQLPIVIIDGIMISYGGKISIPAIRKHLEEIGVQAVSV